MTESDIDRFVREPECRGLSGLSRSTRWRLTQRSEFPAPISISPNAVGWRLSEIRAWIDAKVDAASTNRSTTSTLATKLISVTPTANRSRPRGRPQKSARLPAGNGATS